MKEDYKDTQGRAISRLARWFSPLPDRLQQCLQLFLSVNQRGASGCAADWFNSATSVQPIFTSPTPLTTSVQGGFVPRYPVGWDPASGLGMPPEFFIPSIVGQTSVSTSLPTSQQASASTSQPIPADGLEFFSASTNGTNQHVGFPTDASSAKFGNADTANDSYRNPCFKVTSPSRS